jgi:uncharacterized protein YegP (UPF0339 family)
MTFQAYKDASGEWRWRLIAKNGETVADSAEGYRRKGGCVKAIERLKAAVVDAKVVEVLA